jgi:hypothetical protein
MDEDAIIRHVADTFAGVNIVRPKPGEAPDLAVGDTFFIYDPDRNLEPKHQMPFATIVTKDYGEFDNASDLNRPGVFRLNIGVGKETFQSLFGDRTGHDFTALDTLLPHPVYGPQSWVCVLNPSAATFEAAVRPLLKEAYDLAIARYNKLTKR